MKLASLFPLALIRRESSMARYFPSGINGDAATASNTGGTSWFATGGSGTISTDSPCLGSHTSVRMVASSTSGVVHTQRTFGSATTLGGDVYFILEATPSGEVTQKWVGTGSTRGFAFNISSARRIILRDSANGAAWTSTAILAVSSTTIVRIAYQITQSATVGTAEIQLFTGTDPEALTQIDTASLTNLNTGATGYDTERDGAKAATGTQTITTRMLSFDISPGAGTIPAAWTLASENVAPTVGLIADFTTLFPGEVATLAASATDSDGTIVSQNVTCDIVGILAGTWPNYTITSPASLTDQTATATASATDNLGATTTATQVITLKASMTKMYDGTQWVPLIEYLIT